MSANSPARESLLRAAVEMFGESLIVWPLVVSVSCRDTGSATSCVFTEADWKAALVAELAAADADEGLSELAEDIWEAADKQWRTSVDLSRLTGCEYNGTFRKEVATLLRRGLLERQKRTRRLRRTTVPHQRPPDDSQGESNS